MELNLPQAINLVTVNDGDYRVLERNSRLDAFITEVLPLVLAVSQETDDGWQVADVEAGKGFVGYALKRRGEISALCVACWEPAVRKEAWNRAEEIYLKVGDADPHLDLPWVDTPAPRTPWLCTVYTRHFDALPDPEAERLMHLADAACFGFIGIGVKD